MIDEYDLLSSSTDTLINKLKTIVKEVGHLNSRYKNGNTLLHLTVEHDRCDFLVELLEFNPDLNIKGIFHVNIKGTFGMTALCLAGMEDNLEVAEILLTAGANPNIIHDRSYLFLFPTVLHYAIHNNNVEMTSLLLKFKVNFKLKDNMGKYIYRNIIYRAINLPSIDILVLLLKAGADPNLRSYHYAPLHNAVRHRKPNMVQELLNYRADVNIEKSDNGNTQLHLCLTSY